MSSAGKNVIWAQVTTERSDRAFEGDKITPRQTPVNIKSTSRLLDHISRCKLEGCDVHPNLWFGWSWGSSGRCQPTGSGVGLFSKFPVVPKWENDTNRVYGQTLTHQGIFLRHMGVVICEVGRNCERCACTTRRSRGLALTLPSNLHSTYPTPSE